MYWIAQGKRDSEIVKITGVAVRTVNKHVEHLLEKLNAETRVAAVSITHEKLPQSGWRCRSLASGEKGIARPIGGTQLVALTARAGSRA